MAKTKSATIAPYLEEAIAKDASDIHFIVGLPPTLRIDGVLKPLDEEPLTVENNEEILSKFLGEKLKTLVEETKKELDFSFPFKDHRFRTNVYYEKGNLSASLRLLPNKTRNFEELGVPAIVEKFVNVAQGLLIVTGPTGHGKSTTLASIVDKINSTRKAHIITIEDPIEYVFEHKKSMIAQREVGHDTPSFASALRAALREDPDVVLIGEMRDLETMEAALTIAETGHLVLTTLHTNSAAQTTDRIIDVFPERQQTQVRSQLASVLLGVLSQRLLPRVSGGRILATEIMIANPAVKSIIREGKTHQLPNIIQTSASEGMIALNKVLAEFVHKGEINVDDALAWTDDPKSLNMLIY